MTNTILAIDQGTSQTKALIIGSAGAVLATHSAPVRTTIIGETQIEQDPLEIIESVHAACAPLLGRYPASIVGLDNQGETFLLWDAPTGAPLTPAISWQDKRGAALCAQLEADGYGPFVQARTGLLLDSYFSASKLAWVLNQDVQLRRRAEAGELRFGTVDTWLLWRLSREAGQPPLHITDPSTASRTLLFNIHTLQWDDELLQLFNIPRALLPAVVPSAGYVGQIKVADHLVEVHALLCDQQAALFGQGCLSPGEAKCTFGTGAFLLVNTGECPAQSKHGLLSTIGWQTPALTHYALDGGIFIAGAAVEWLRDELGIIINSAESGPLAEQADPATTPLYIPALAGLAAPHWQPQARGTIFGLSRGSGRAELTRATLTGLAMRVGDVLRAMQTDAELDIASLRVDGGPARNHFLMQAVADDLGIEVQVAAEIESTATGIGQLARHAAMGVTLKEISAAWRAATTYQPTITVTERQNRRGRWEQALKLAAEFYQAG
ncbi:MAG: FGGY family carbohydrate kinase [Anaerolineae bacterium]